MTGTADPIERLAAALNAAWPGRSALGMDWPWTCEHQPTLAGECRHHARVAWDCALATLRDSATGDDRLSVDAAAAAASQGAAA